ncbi:hypothetical protein DITRI_Ditri02bG0019500 [Diplodiscus trichospermus]
MTFIEYKCDQTSGNYAPYSAYQANLNSIVSQFSSLRVFNHGFFYQFAGKSPDIVHTSALCRGDLNQDRCNRCLNYTATELKHLCPTNKAAAWSEFCLVRYANRNMYGLLENDPRTCVYNVNNASNPAQFNQALNALLNDLSSKAAAGGPLRKYAASNAPTGYVETVYAMVQCTPDMDQRNCNTCLNFAESEYQKCCSGRLQFLYRPAVATATVSSNFFSDINKRKRA